MYHLTKQYKTAWALRLAVSILSFAVMSPVQAENCTMQLSDATIDYGYLNHRADLANKNQAGQIAIGKRFLTLNIVCQQNTEFALQFHAPTNDQKTFRFSTAGSFNLRLSNAEVDGKAVILASTQATDATLNTIATTAQLAANQTVTALFDTLPASGKTFSAQVEVDAHIAAAALRVREATRVEERGTFVLVQH